jgi:hypothetical protein
MFNLCTFEFNGWPGARSGWPRYATLLRLKNGALADRFFAQARGLGPEGRRSSHSSPGGLRLRRACGAAAVLQRARAARVLSFRPFASVFCSGPFASVLCFGLEINC